MENFTEIEEPLICEPGGSGQWLPFGGEWESNLSKRVRIILYFCGMIYSFLGVSIVADMFMAGIERITSIMKCTRIPRSSRFRTTPVWNETVANLTLMALGSSAPEILLSLNDVIKRNFVAGKLGAATIVGSAAFNMFVIIAVCINSIPAGEVRYIKETGVYGITAFFSIFAYFLLLFISAIHTPNEIDLSEGVFVFCMFPVLVITSYLADIKVLTVASIKGLFWKSGDAAEKVEAPRTFLEKFRAQHACEMEEDEDEETKAAKARIEATKAAKAARNGETIRGSFSVRSFFAKKEKEAEGDENEEEGLNDKEAEMLANPEYDILDEEDNPIENDAGVLTFDRYSMTVGVGAEEMEYTVKVLRKNGTEGKVTCQYRMDQLSAIPGYGFEAEEGTVQFRDGVISDEITFKVLPKKVGEMSDRFQLVLFDPEGGAELNPDYDGGDNDCNRLTIMIKNTQGPPRLPIRPFFDKLLNLDELRQGTELWKDQIMEALYCGGSKEDQDNAGFLDWLNHLIWLPWTGLFALITPPPAFFGGWVCFIISLGHIAWLTIIIGDIAELFGCVAGVDDSITAISFVALGTSVPDLFASRAAATQDEYADASIVNVTGSNSVNVFLGIGLPWMMAAAYWTMQGSTFKINSDGLGFSVIVFSIYAVVTLTVISFRRWKIGGELGGPNGIKAYSSFLLLLLWVSYIGLSTWKYSNRDAAIDFQVLMVAASFPVIALCILAFAGVRLALRISKDYIGEEGFWGIFVALSVIGLRLIGFFLFQMQ
eukprot:CAMPEP_0115132222 /NCGR_PEP_ID=MMETSP0227-20121206/53607_1 /TAXON_ID=89957 /ORGANISM="Polarella glacialis, Strain CCMP 1383" /LENGTH=768 /DNA_ID=CAMNT_0002537939 /DNA_START=9 /DNA_END=2315 /DNA_ORIENTATION=-